MDVAVQINLMKKFTRKQRINMSHKDKKIRLIRTMVTEYVPETRYYEPGSTFEEIAQIDASSDDLESVFTELESDEVVWQVVDGDGKVLSDSEKYRTFFKDNVIFIEFHSDEDSEWEESRMSFNVEGLSLDQVNEQVKALVQIRLNS